MKIFGVIGSVIVFMAGVFKFQHWPGASYMLIIGMFLCVLFLCSWFMTARKNATSGKQKAVVLITFLGGLLTAIAATFKIMHWPNSGILTMVSIGFILFAFIPVHIAYIVGETDETRGNNAAGFMVTFLALTAIILSLGGSRIWVDAVTRPAKAEGSFAAALKSSNDHIFGLLSADSAKGGQAAQIRKVSAELSGYIDALEAELKATSCGDMKVDEKAAEYNDLCHPGDFDTPSRLMIGSDASTPNTGKFSGTELKSKLMNYSAELNRILNSDGKFNTGIDLSEITTSDGIMETWEVACFYHSPMAVVIDHLESLKTRIATVAAKKVR